MQNQLEMLFLIRKRYCSSQNQKTKVREIKNIVCIVVRKEKKIVPRIKSYD